MEDEIALDAIFVRPKVIEVGNDVIDARHPAVGFPRAAFDDVDVPVDFHEKTVLAFLVETATDNTNRTVASLRMYFNKCGGTLGTSGSVAFMFEHKCVFKFRVPAGTDLEELELEMIDLEVDEFYPEEDTITVYAPYESFGAIQKWIEDKGFETISGESVRIPVDTKELSAEERESVEKLQERIEEDDDVVNVYTNMREPEDDEADEE